MPLKLHISFEKVHDLYKKYANTEFEIHDSELQYHGKEKTELIYDDNNYFIFHDLKFVSFLQLYAMKAKRNEEKDKNDCLIMKTSLEGSSYKKIIAQLKQKKFYMKIKLQRSFLTFSMKLLRFLRLYTIVRSILIDSFYWVCLWL